jgi:hypothetical protein
MRIALLLIASAFAAVCAAPPPMGDSAIQAAIQAKFAKSKIAEEKFRVTVKAGVAYIEGKTDIPQRKGVATRLAKTGGAKEVVNRIEVGEAARKKLTDRLQKAREAKPPTTPKPPAVAVSGPAPAAHSPVAAPTQASTPAPTPDPPPLRRMQVKR